MLNKNSKLLFTLNEKKAVEVAEYILSRLGKKANYMFLLKLIFFADRYHLRKYHRPVTTDEYFAMKRGPVASFLYDVFKGNREDVTTIKRSKKNTYNVELYTKTQNYEELSDSDIEAIDFSLSNFTSFGDDALAEITHAYPEWEKFSKRFTQDTSGREEMNYEDFLKNANSKNKIFIKYKIKDPYEPISDRSRKEIIEQIEEYCSQIS